MLCGGAAGAFRPKRENHRYGPDPDPGRAETALGTRHAEDLERFGDEDLRRRASNDDRLRDEHDRTTVVAYPPITPCRRAARRGGGRGAT